MDSEWYYKIVCKRYGKNVLGYVKDGGVYYNDKIRIEISGDVKILIVPNDLAVHLSMEGTASGEMVIRKSA